MADDHRKRIGRRIRTARERKGWTQKQLAHALDVTESQISRWENGHAMPQPHTRDAIADALDTVAERFLYDGE